MGIRPADPAIQAEEKHKSASFPPPAPRRSADKDAADFIDIVTFDALAATCGEYLTKGRQVAVVGRLRLNEWTTPDGERRSKIQVVADDVSFLDKPKAANGPADE